MMAGGGMEIMDKDEEIWSSSLPCFLPVRGLVHKSDFLYTNKKNNKNKTSVLMSESPLMDVYDSEVTLPTIV